MHKLVAVALGAVLALAALPVMAADNAQQDKMKACNTKAAGMTGDARKDFMSKCLSADAAKAPAAAAAPMTQQDKMKACNTKAGDMKGDDRKKFMSSCLAG